jgi:hypothetical protein
MARVIQLSRERELFHPDQKNWRFASPCSRQFLLAVLEKLDEPRAAEFQRAVEKRVEETKCDTQ